MSLKEYLATALPQNEEFDIFHMQTTPQESHSIITPADGESRAAKDNFTVKTCHFFTIFYKGKVFFGLEIYVYITLRKGYPEDTDRLLFVSKADTTGYIDIPVSVKNITKQILSYLLSINPNYYIKYIIPLSKDYGEQKNTLINREHTTLQALNILANRHNNIDPTTQLKANTQPTDSFYYNFSCPDYITTRISLFTRSSPQYLFPESSKNKVKHVLNGSDLVKWWLRIIDEILNKDFNSNTISKLYIPGYNQYEIARYFNTLQNDNLWTVGTIFGDDNPNQLAVYTIPLFPDDPKSRFLHQLVEESRILNTNLSTFWLELQERQEFRSGDTVSVIGVSGIIKHRNLIIPDPSEMIILPSKKQFKYIRNYIAGEDYSTDEGAIDAYINIRDYLETRLNTKLIVVRGTNQYHHSTSQRAQKRGQVVTILQPRKKAKK